MAVKTISYDGQIYELSYEMLNLGALNFRSKQSENTCNYERSESTCHSERSEAQRRISPKAQKSETDSIESAQNIESTSSRVLLFLHGWGANKRLMKLAFGECFKDFCHIYLDLPGFGESSPPKIPINSTQYAKIVKEFLRALGVFDICAVFGHSFGGKVGAILCVDSLNLMPPCNSAPFFNSMPPCHSLPPCHSERSEESQTQQKQTHATFSSKKIKIQNLVLLSSAGILLKKPLKVRAKIAAAKILKALGLGFLARIFKARDAAGLNPTMYEIFKIVVGEDCAYVFEKLEPQNNQTDSIKTKIFWGEEDTATPLHAGKQIATLSRAELFCPLAGDHFFFLKAAKIIESKCEFK